MSEKFEISVCPCCGRTPRISHNLCVEGSEAHIVCSCGLEMTIWDDYNSFKAERKAIIAWNKTVSDRKKIKIDRNEV